MPDWKQIVRKHLRVVAFCSPEVIEELATHLEDSYEALLGEGLPAELALQRAMGQSEGCGRVWLVMRLLQEEFMSGVMGEVALPGLCTSAAAGILYWALALTHAQPGVIWLVGGQLPLWWWCLLPVCGALGALLSRRKGGSRAQRIAASLLPSAIMGIVVLLFFAAGYTLSGLVNHYGPVFEHLESMGIGPPGFVVIPAVFSLLGTGIAEVSTGESGRLA